MERNGSHSFIEVCVLDGLPSNVLSILGGRKNSRSRYCKTMHNYERLNGEWQLNA